MTIGIGWPACSRTAIIVTTVKSFPSKLPLTVCFVLPWLASDVAVSASRLLCRHRGGRTDRTRRPLVELRTVNNALRHR